MAQNVVNVTVKGHKNIAIWRKGKKYGGVFLSFFFKYKKKKGEEQS